MTKILVADDHTLVRESIIKSLAINMPDVIFGEAENATGVMGKVEKEDWDLLILDLNMPGRNGLDVINDLKKYKPEMPIVVLSMYPEDQFALRVIKAGAVGYLTKNTSSEELLKAIKVILKGEQYITRSIARLLTEGLRSDSNKLLHESLSNREFQVLLLIASGKSISDIAVELTLSVKTISVYRSNILNKMNLKNNSEITHYAFKHRLVE
jgi:two-component system, NarL family, invasion response regulator UvrY